MTGAASVTHLLYLHGFRSSPQSFKAQRMARHMAAHHPSVTWWCPQLPVSPREAMALLRSGLAGWPAATTGLVGSSLGGFYATVLAENMGCGAVLLNPAVYPARDLANRVGEWPSYHDPAVRMTWRSEHVDELRAMAPEALSDPSRYFTVIAKGDELLDWREMTARYADSAGKLLKGSDHGLSDFEDHLEDVMRFLGLMEARV